MKQRSNLWGLDILKDSFVTDALHRKYIYGNNEKQNKKDDYYKFSHKFSYQSRGDWYFCKCLLVSIRIYKAASNWLYGWEFCLLLHVHQQLLPPNFIPIIVFDKQPLSKRACNLMALHRSSVSMEWENSMEPKLTNWKRRL